MKKLTLLIFLSISYILFSCREDLVRIVNQEDTLPISLLMEFKTDETSGNTTVETRTNKTFTIHGNHINRMTGVSGSSLFFDGLTNYFDGSVSTNTLSPTKIVVSLWAAPRSYPLSYAPMISTNEPNSSTGFSIGINNSGNIVVQYYINGSYAEQVTTQSVEKFKWSNIQVGINPEQGNFRIYLNNVLAKSGTLPNGTISYPTGDTKITVGKNPLTNDAGTSFSGSIDEIRIYEGECTDEVANFIYSAYVNPGEASYNTDFDYSADTNRPTYHAVPDYGWANESYGLIYHNNEYHMFFQKNDVFLGIAKQNWGHFTSPDLVNWSEKNPVLWPEQLWEKEGIWSGGSIIQQDGTPTLYYTGVNGIRAGIGIATSNDNFATVIKDASNPVIPQAPPSVNMDFRDPFVWWENGKYHMIIGSGISGVGGNIVYYHSTDFKNWEGGDVAFQGKIGSGDGQFWEMPVIYTFPNGKKILVVQKTPDSSSNPARTFYWTGTFVNGKFVADNNQSKDFEVVNGFLSPTVTTDKDGKATAIGIIPDEVTGEFQQQQGWAHLFSVPQVWTLNSGNNLVITPHPNLNALRGATQTFSNVNVTPNGSGYFGNYQNRHFEMEATVDVGNASKVGFIFGKSANGQEQYKVYYDAVAKQWVVDASQSSNSTQVRKDIRKGNYNISNGKFNVRIYIDGSVLEVFVDGKSHFTGRFFPTLPDAKGVDMFTEGGNATVNATLYNLKQK